MLEHALESLIRTNGYLTSLRCTDGSVFEAKVLVDATYEGDLMAAAGVRYFTGREGRSTYGESLAGIQDVHRLDTVLDATNLVKNFMLVPVIPR